MDQTRAPYQPGLTSAGTPQFAGIGLNKALTANRRLDITGLATDTVILNLANTASSLSSGTLSAIGGNITTDTGNITGTVGYGFGLSTMLVSLTLSKTIANTSGTCKVYGETIGGTLTGETGFASTSTGIGRQELYAGALVAWDQCGDQGGRNNICAIDGCIGEANGQPGGLTKAFAKTGGTNSMTYRGVYGHATFDDQFATGTIDLTMYGAYCDAALTNASSITYNSANFYGVYAVGRIATGAATGTAYGIYATASGASTNWAAHLDGNVKIGSGAAGVDYRLTFDGETNDGVLDWMEDEDYFRFSDDIYLVGGENLVLSTTTGTKIGTATTQLLGFYNSTPVDQPAALTAQLTSITHTAPGTPDYALQNLVQNTGFGFVTADEGNTLLSVVLNLQVRLAEVEARLEELGLVAAN